MRTSSERILEPALPFEGGRTGPAPFLLALLRPGDAKAATVDANVLALALPFGTRTIPIQGIESVSVTRAWFWRSAPIRHAYGREAVSGLSRHQARTLINALEAARLGWWRRTFATHIETRRSVHDLLVQLADPPRYMARSVFSDLERNAEKAVGEFPSRWPNALTGTPEIRILKIIQDFKTPKVTGREPTTPLSSTNRPVQESCLTGSRQGRSQTSNDERSSSMRTAIWSSLTQAAAKHLSSSLRLAGFSRRASGSKTRSSRS